MIDRTFDPIAVLRMLEAHRVRYVLIGGLAAKAHGSPSLTVDLDICYDRAPDNLELLAAALAELYVELRSAPPGLPFKLDSRTLRRGDHFTLRTSLGDVDLLGTPAGTNGYDELIANAEQTEVDQGLLVSVTSLDDLIRMKRASGRPKDRIELEILGALREEIERQDTAP